MVLHCLSFLRGSRWDPPRDKWQMPGRPGLGPTAYGPRSSRTQNGMRFCGERTIMSLWQVWKFGLHKTMPGPMGWLLMVLSPPPVSR